MAPPTLNKNPRSKNSASQKRNGRSISKPKVGLTLTGESPGRPLESFSGFERSPKERSRVSTAQSSKLPIEDTRKTLTDPFVGKEDVESSGPKRNHASNEQDQMWVDRYAPQSKADLAIHTGKIKDVEGWLNSALDSQSTIHKYRKLLVLSGPAGAGKSTLIRILSSPSEMDFDIFEWSNDGRSNLSEISNWDHGRARYSEFDNGRSSTYTSTLQNRFKAFLSQSSRYNALNVEREEAKTLFGSNRVHGSKKSRRVILVDDLPNIQYGPVREAFQEAILDFINLPQREGFVPLILILSDAAPRLDDWSTSNTMQGWKERNEESLSVRNLLPESVLKSPNLVHISFNPVAPTILEKALHNIVRLEKKQGAVQASAISGDVLKQLLKTISQGSNGDVRSAINSLQISFGSSSYSIPAKAVKRTANGEFKDSTRAVKKLFITYGREASLSNFHTLGKVLYNRRIGDPKKESKKSRECKTDSETESENEPQNNKYSEMTEAMKKFTGNIDTQEKFDLPDHLQHLFRRESEVNVEKLWRTMPMDTSLLQLFLHQNYIQFCEDIDQCNALMENFSDADVMKPSHEEWFHSSLTSYYSFLVSTHGILMSLPSPMPQGKQRGFHGKIAFLESGRRLRKNHDTLGELKAALNATTQHCNQSGRDEECTRSILSEIGLDQMSYEALPLVSKCRTLPEDIRECVEMDLQWGRTSTTETFSFNKWEKDGGLEDISLEEESIEPLAESQLYDKDGKRFKVKVMRNKVGRRLGNDDTNLTSLNALELIQGQRDGKVGDTSKTEENTEEDEEIEDFD